MESIEKLYNTILERKNNPQEGSYTNYLFEQGIDKILKKVGEECSEVIIAAKNSDKEQVILETSDLLYHLSVLWAEMGISPREIDEEMKKRSNKIGNLKQFKNTNTNT